MIAKRLSFAGAILTAAVIALWTTPNVATSQSFPKDFTFEKTKPLGPVTFSHKMHVGEKKLQCPDCHTKLFQMKRVAAMKMAEINNGEYCGACHNGKKAFSAKDSKNCAKCHAKK